MKFFLTFTFFCLASLNILAESMQIIILSSDRYNISENATLKGSKEYAKMAKTRLGVDINIEIHQAERNEALKEQILSYKAENIPAIILSTHNSTLPEGFDAFLAEVCNDNFNIAIINPSQNLENALVSLKADRKEEVKGILDFIGKRRGKMTSKMIYLFKGDKFAKIDEAQATELISNTFDAEEFASLYNNTANNDFFSTKDISSFLSESGNYLPQLDYYAIIITDKELLYDLALIKADKDRRFILSLETNAMSLANMETKILTATILQDFFGYGFLSTKALVEKTLENITPSQKLQKLPPTICPLEKLEELKKTCQSWLM